jgi:hypothetical protein
VGLVELVVTEQVQLDHLLFFQQLPQTVVAVGQQARGVRQTVDRVVAVTLIQADSLQVV